MANDPTQPVRDAVKKGLKFLVPKDSPLAQSGDDVLTPEARAKVDAENAQRAPADLTQAQAPVQAPVNFVSPGVQPAPAAPSPMGGMSVSGDPLGTYMQGANLEANAIKTMGDQEAGAYQNVQNELAGINQEIQNVQTKEEKAFEEFNKEDEETRSAIKNFKLEPKNFFAGKATWQKILGGVGMFLGSITPEGAKNVANIIDREIDLDLERQKNELALLKDTRSEAANRYKMKLDKYGSEKLAKMSMKKDALEMVKLKIDGIASSAKGDLARGAALKGKATIEQSQQTLQATMMKEYMKLNKDAKKGMLPGYSGTNENPSIIKEMTDRVTAQNSANNSITDLENLLKDGALVGKNRAIADQVRTKLAADLAKAMFGRSSDSELAIAMSLIPDISSMTQRGSVDKTLLSNLRKKLSQDVDAAARAAGFSKSMPAGARKVE